MFTKISCAMCYMYAEKEISGTRALRLVVKEERIRRYFTQIDCFINVADISSRP